MSIDAPPRPAASTPGLAHVVRLARRRMRVNRALATLGPALVVAAGVACLWLLVGRVVLLPDVDLWVIVGALVLAVAAVVTAAAVRIPDTWAAWAADRWLDTRDAFATAVELRSRPDTAVHQQQVAAAEARASTVDGLPNGPNVPRRWLARGALAVLATALLAAAPNPQDEVRERRAIEQALVTEEAEQLREQAEELREAGDPELDALADELEDLADELTDGSLEEAMEELAEARARLEEQLADDLASQRTALSGLAQELSRQPVAEGDTVRQQLERLGDEAGEGQHAGDEELAERLESLADALASGQPGVADALSRAADALRSGDAAGAEQALGEASDAVGGALDELLDQQARSDAAGAVGEAGDQLGDAQDALDRGEDPTRGDGNGSGEGSGDGSGEGDGSGDGSGDGDGNGSGDGSGQGDGSGDGSGSGSGDGSGSGQGQGNGNAGGGGGGGNPTGDQGQGGPNTGGGTPNAGTPGELDLETIYDPPSGTIDGEDVTVGGQDSGSGDSDTVGTREGQGTRNLSIVPYLDVLAEYQERASRTIDRPGFPVDKRNLVRDYFDRIGRLE